MSTYSPRHRPRCAHCLCPHCEGTAAHIAERGAVDDVIGITGAQKVTKFSQVLLVRKPNQVRSSLPICVQKAFLPSCGATSPPAKPGTRRTGGVGSRTTRNAGHGSRHRCPSFTFLHRSTPLPPQIAKPLKFLCHSWRFERKWPNSIAHSSWWQMGRPAHRRPRPWVLRAPSRDQSGYCVSESSNTARSSCPWHLARRDPQYLPCLSSHPPLPEWDSHYPGPERQNSFFAVTVSPDCKPGPAGCWSRPAARAKAEGAYEAAPCNLSALRELGGARCIVGALRIVEVEVRLRLASYGSAGAWNRQTRHSSIDGYVNRLNSPHALVSTDEVAEAKERPTLPCARPDGAGDPHDVRRSLHQPARDNAGPGAIQDSRLEESPDLVLARGDQRHALGSARVRQGTGGSCGGCGASPGAGHDAGRCGRASAK
jgi:hypothetical protein